ncbi:DUF6428 family protein [Mucilaginibacter panaciglaebae]|uniref:DUF6428 family protein n=1 Tax=Mucilaginibacter panaciglaebae TaxID=502331 RepID=A0ABP7X4L0_9SPHI
MENTILTDWQTFKQKLLSNKDLTLQFQYAPGKWVDASYHITEIKQALITSVDCGGKVNKWTEIIIQLWESQTNNSQQGMEVQKALSIINVVEKSLPLNPAGVVKIEFGNSQFDTRQMYPAEFLVSGDNLIVILSADQTQCKAIGRGDTCGDNSKPKIQLVTLTDQNSCCTPGSGCC